MLRAASKQRIASAGSAAAQRAAPCAIGGGHHRCANTRWTGASAATTKRLHVSAHHAGVFLQPLSQPPPPLDDVPTSARAVSVPVALKGAPIEVARVQSVPLHRPASREVMVRIAAAAINPIDTMLCGGYGRQLVTIASALRDTHSACAADATLETTPLALGRECVGTVVRLGENVWDLALGSRVWLAPGVGSPALAEYATVARSEVSLAPSRLSDIEAATYPFAASTAWTALVDCAGIQPTPLAHQNGSASSSSPFSFMHSLGFDPAHVQAGIDLLSRVPPLPSLDQLRDIRLDPAAPKRAIVHGASGQVGLVAVQLLQHWGYEVFATTVSATRGSLDALLEKQTASGLATPTLHIVNTEETSIESVVAHRSISVFLDGVGGVDVLEAALPLLAQSGQFVTLRGEGVKKTDEEGLVQGALQGGAQYMQYKARAAEYGANYRWAISAPNAAALDYVRRLIDVGSLHTNLLPIHVWRGLEAAPAALQAAHEESKSKAVRPRHVVLPAALATPRSTNLHGSTATFGGTSKRAFSTRAAPASPPFRIVMFASSDFSIPALQALRTHAPELLQDGKCTIVTPADKPTGRGRVVTPSAFKLAALKCNFDVVQLPIDISFKMTGWELPADLKGRVDVGVVVSFGYMLPHSLIAEFPMGVINIHPSLLPRYRGSSPIQFALAQGDEETGVSIIDVHPTQIDGGNIISQEKTVVPRGATFESMSSVLAAQGAKQLIAVLQNLAASRNNSQSQSALLAAAPPTPTGAVDPRSSAPRIPKSAGELLFLVHSPETLYRVWSACKGFTPSFTHFNGQRVILHGVMHPQTARDLHQQAARGLAATPPDATHFPTFAEAQQLGVGGLFFDAQLQSLGVICSSSSLDDPRVLYITELQLSGKKSPVSASVFASGYLDKRKIKQPNQSQSWKFTQSSDIEDWFGPKLAGAVTPL